MFDDLNCHPAVKRTYQLHVVQQPSIGAEFGNAVLSRLPLAPPLIVQVIVRDTYGQTVLP
jgi:hypothetical protein